MKSHNYCFKTESELNPEIRQCCALVTLMSKLALALVLGMAFVVISHWP